MEKRIKHLEMIEAIIERMCNNCFRLKGWTITLVVLILTLSSQGADKRGMLVTIIPIFSFCLLDTYYLQLERKYRVLYKTVANKKEEEIDFNMDYNTAINSVEDKKYTKYYRCLISFSILLFYCAVVLTVFAFLFILIVI